MSLVFPVLYFFNNVKKVEPTKLRISLISGARKPRFAELIRIYLARVDRSNKELFFAKSNWDVDLERFDPQAKIEVQVMQTGKVLFSSRLTVERALQKA